MVKLSGTDTTLDLSHKGQSGKESGTAEGQLYRVRERAHGPGRDDGRMYYEGASPISILTPFQSSN